MSFLSTAPYKGTRDFYPDDYRTQQWLFQKMSQVATSYGYEAYNGPMLEPFDLYAAKTGEEIVNQQLYHLTDKSDRKLAVRPEMTPTLARMVAGKIHELPRPIRWYSLPNLWRYEKPQRGRLREHWQLNVDVLGGEARFADAEILLLAMDVMKSVGGESKVALRVNHRNLMDTFFTYTLKLNVETALKVSKAIDARSKIGEQAYQKWLTDLGLSQESIQALEEFFHSPFEKTSEKYPCLGTESLKTLLSDLKGLPIEFDPTLFRGLDYYTGIVFEMFDTSPENKRAMFGGGRYDNLIGLFGKQKLSGVGFGMGDVTFLQFLETHKLVPSLPKCIDVWIGLPHGDLQTRCLEIAKLLRTQGLSVACSLNPEGFGATLKQALKQGARFVILLGEEELAQNQVIVKNLSLATQETVSLGALNKYFKP